jgi:hypothetical protein
MINDFVQAPRSTTQTVQPKATPAVLGSSTNTGTSTSSPGSYQGVVINAGTDAQVAAQMAQIDAQKKGVSTYDATKITNPTGPSSSSTVTTNNNVTTNTNTSTDSANGVKPPMSDIQNKIMSTYGFDENYVRGLDQTTQANFALSLRAEDVAQQQANQAKQEQQQMYNAALAQQNATYAQASQDLSAQKGKDLESAKTTAAQLNPYSGPNTDEAAYSGAINVQYTKLQQQLDNTAAQAKAALDGGNIGAYAKINEKLAEQKTTGLANIQNMLTDLKKSKITEQQLDLANKREERITETTDKNQFLTRVEAFGASPLVQKDLDIFQETGEISTGIKSFIKQGIDAGYTASESLYYLNAGTQKQRQQQALEADKERKNALAEQRLLLAITNSNKTTEPITFKNDALQTVLDNTIVGLNITNKDQVNRVANTYTNAYEKDGLAGLQNEIIGFASKRGDAPSKQDIVSSRKLVNQLNEIQGIREELKNKGVNTGIVNGTIEGLFNYVGNTTDPKLAEMRAKSDRLNNDLVLKYAATTFTDKIYNKIKEQNPSIKKGDKLNSIQEKSLRDSLERDLKVQLEPLVGDYYDDIFGSKASTVSKPTPSGYTPSGEAAEILKRRNIQ